MELQSQVRDRMSLVLLILWTIPAALSGLNLDCTNDYEESMLCQFEAQNCTEYSLTLQRKSGDRELHCIFNQSVDGLCRCSFTEMILVRGEHHTATVWKGGVSMESKTIDVRNTIKPKTPTIISVKESNGNFQVKWKTNYKREHFSNTLMAYVTYHIKGDKQEVSKPVKPTTIDRLNYYEILGQNLTSSTTYVVSIKSYTDSSHMFSDSSEEKEFTTPVSPVILPLVIVISLSIAAVIITGAVYVCYVKLKAKWWDTVAKCPNPKLLTMQPSEQEILKPVPPPISSVCVEPPLPDDSKPWSKGSLRDSSSGSPQQSSGISTGSSCFSYANTESPDIIAGVRNALDKVFGPISPISPLTTNPLAESNKDNGLLSSPINPCGSGSSGIDNKTYSILIPSCSYQIVTDSSEVQTQAEMPCDSTYRPIAADNEPCFNTQEPACPVPTDMTYQQCNADSGGFPYSEESSLSFVSSGTNTVEAGSRSSDEVEQDTTKPHGKPEGADENLCNSCVPEGSRSLPPVDDDYQPFHNLVEQPDVLFLEERRDEKEEHLNKHPEKSFTKMPQSFLSPGDPDFMNNVQGGQCLSELQRPFLSSVPADQSKSLFTDCTYQCV